MNKLLASILVIMVSACGGGGGGDNTVVVDLPAAEQTDLCEQFRSALCDPVVPGVENYCTAECQTNGCASGVQGGLVIAECSGNGDDGTPITVDDVVDCADQFPDDFEACLNRGGGCMFDVLDVACP